MAEEVFSIDADRSVLKDEPLMNGLSELQTKQASQNVQCSLLHRCFGVCCCIQSISCPAWFFSSTRACGGDPSGISVMVFH